MKQSSSHSSDSRIALKKLKQLSIFYSSDVDLNAFKLSEWVKERENIRKHEIDSLFKTRILCWMQAQHNCGVYKN